MTITEIAKQMAQRCQEMPQVSPSQIFDIYCQHLEKQGADHGTMEHFLHASHKALTEKGIDTSWLIK